MVDVVLRHSLYFHSPLFIGQTVMNGLSDQKCKVKNCECVDVLGLDHKAEQNRAALTGPSSNIQ